MGELVYINLREAFRFREWRERQRTKRHKTCKQKVRYEDESDAQARLFNMQDRKVEGHDRLEIYQCRFCGFLHIGHRPLRAVDPIEQFNDCMVALRRTFGDVLTGVVNLNLPVQ